MMIRVELVKMDNILLLLLLELFDCLQPYANAANWGYDDTVSWYIIGNDKQAFFLFFCSADITSGWIEEEPEL